eukprot:518946-Pyramimonas_sp.AAC.1
MQLEGWTAYSAKKMKPNLSSRTLLIRRARPRTSTASAPSRSRNCCCWKSAATSARAQFTGLRIARKRAARRRSGTRGASSSQAKDGALSAWIDHRALVIVRMAPVSPDER